MEARVEAGDRQKWWLGPSGSAGDDEISSSGFSENLFSFAQPMCYVKLVFSPYNALSMSDT